MATTLKRYLTRFMLFVCFQLIPFELWALFAGAAAGQGHAPDPSFNRIVQISVPSKAGHITGYVKPWIANIWNVVWPVEKVIWVAFFIALIAMVLLRTLPTENAN